LGGVQDKQYLKQGRYLKPSQKGFTAIQYVIESHQNRNASCDTFKKVQRAEGWPIRASCSPPSHLTTPQTSSVVPKSEGMSSAWCKKAFMAAVLAVSAQAFVRSTVYQVCCQQV
jgi:hypothetical protein